MHAPLGEEAVDDIARRAFMKGTGIGALAFTVIMQTYRGWLAQLPEDQARRIAHGNAEWLFGGKVE
jgi:hypothetical protein